MICKCILNGEPIFVPTEDPKAIERLNRNAILSAASWRTKEWSLQVSFHELPDQWFAFEQLKTPEKEFEVAC